MKGEDKYAACMAHVYLPGHGFGTVNLHRLLQQSDKSVSPLSKETHTNTPRVEFHKKICNHLSS